MELDEILEQGSKAVPEDAGPYYTAAEALSESGLEPGRAERYIEKYLSQPPEGKQPTQGKARWLLARVYTREGKTADAIRELQTALHLEPSLEPAQRDLKRLTHS
jgi:tetratricopeptide (TPR) repeat protein